MSGYKRLLKSRYFEGARLRAEADSFSYLHKGVPTMKLVVLGATGGTGLEIVRQAIEHGHSVTALVRSPERLKPFGNRVTVKQGDLLNTAELAKAITGHDAILSGFGPRVPIAKTDANLLRNFATPPTTPPPQTRAPRAPLLSTA